MAESPKVVILGAGYGGMITSRVLEKELKSGEADVTLINKHHYHYISTRLHKTGAGTEIDEKVALPISDLLKTNKVSFKKGTVENIDFSNKKVYLENGEKVEYDYLLIALGFDVATFGVPGVEEHAFKIRSFRSSKAIYNHILKQFESYKEDQDPSRLTFVVAGAGFSGIEFVGELIDHIPQLCKKYDIPVEKTKIVNIEMAGSVLPSFDQKAIDFTTSYLKKHHVQLMTSTKIVECRKDAVVLEKGAEILTKTFVWACGVKGNSLCEKLNLPLIKGRIPVNEYLQVKGHEHVYCIGDSSYCLKDGQTPLPPTAQVAIQQAQWFGANIAAIIRGEKTKPFAYHHKGTVASIGKNAAVGNVFGFKITGMFAAMMKQIVEARYLLILGGPNLLLKQFLRHEKSFEQAAESNK